MSQESIQRDLHNKLAGQLEQLLEREFHVAQAVLPPVAIGENMLKLAAGITCSAISAILQIRREVTDPAEAFDSMLGLLNTMAAGRKAEVLDALQLIEAGKVGEARAKYCSERAR